MTHYPPSKAQKSSQLTTNPATAAAVVAFILFGLDSENINNCRTPQAIINTTDFGRGALKLGISLKIQDQIKKSRTYSEACPCLGLFMGTSLGLI